MRKLLEILLHYCQIRDFKTRCSDGQLRYSGICSILTDIYEEGIITREEYERVRLLINSNKPDDAKDGHWYDSTKSGNRKRVDFLRMLIKNHS